ncbi:hypothetical protein [Methanonatronarchaeum sp. AMET-Sl]|uniref:hypothetical protein n=1 Tax=Methanonatronarchaeum sp. AMET-Sl TaxID=3037654 RepID=UPI00244E351A|nr:hypothetical protein [Methanonatronarchaeum sp. AMET-Sl]WGI16965.1 hypothetical protein QEN48_05545 [Methanonatronarchaeum sp. AMET-Sl]
MSSRGKDTLDFYDFSDQVIELAEDSKHHKEMLEEIFTKIDLPLIQNIGKQKEELFKLYFKNMEQYHEYIFINLIKNEDMMIDLYTEIQDRLKPKDIEVIWLDKEPQSFFETIDELIESEEKHQKYIIELLNHKEFRDLVGCVEIESIEELSKLIKKTERNLNKIRHGIQDVLVIQVDSLKLLRESKKSFQDKHNINIRSIEKIDDKNTMVLDLTSSYG